jgi:hypothetical protein
VKKTLVFKYENGRFRAYLPESLVNKDSESWNLEPPVDAAINDVRNGFIIKNVIWNAYRKTWDAHRREHPTYGDLAEILVNGFNYKKAELSQMAAAIFEDLSKTNIFKENVQYGTPLNPKNPHDREYMRRGIGYEEEIAPQRECWKKHGIKEGFI